MKMQYLQRAIKQGIPVLAYILADRIEDAMFVSQEIGQ